MIPWIDLWPLLVAWAIGVASPGPAVLSIAGAGMGSGRRVALTMAFGVWSGSLIWAALAGFGMSAVLLAHAWLFQALRYAGAAYLLFLAIKSARRAMNPRHLQTKALVLTPRKAWRRGLLVHITNPKAALFWGALFAVAVPPTSPHVALWQVGLSCLTVSLSVMIVMALLFSSRAAAQAYTRAGRLFEGVFAGIFGYAALSVLTTRAL